MVTDAIRVNDRLRDSGGAEWRVAETRPGGHVLLVKPDRTRLLETYVRIIRASYTRAEG